MVTVLKYLKFFFDVLVMFFFFSFFSIQLNIQQYIFQKVVCQRNSITFMRKASKSEWIFSVLYDDIIYFCKCFNSNKKNDENAEVGVLRKIRTKVYALKIILSGPISLSFFFWILKQIFDWFFNWKLVWNIRKKNPTRGCVFCCT